MQMAGKDNKKTVETLTHDEARRKQIPTAEYQSVMRKEEEQPIRIAVKVINHLGDEVMKVFRV
jgi:uncharacterized protein YnzC (UPF0291/DUF896 family)